MTPDERAEIEPEFNRALEMRETNVRESIRILQTLNRRYPDHAPIVGVLGGIYHDTKDWVRALYWYEKAVKLSPKSQLASIGLFHSLWRNGRFSDALDEAKRFIASNGITNDYRALMSELDDGGVFG